MDSDDVEKSHEDCSELINEKQNESQNWIHFLSSIKQASSFKLPLYRSSLYCAALPKLDHHTQM